MKVGVRKPSIKKSIKARTTGRVKRSIKKSVNPLYGKKGMGLINNPKKAVYNKDNPSQDIDFNIATTCTMEQPYIVNEKFFGDTHRRFIIRHATGAELAKPKKFNKDAAISTLKEIYRYYHYEFPGSSKPEETPGYEDQVPL